MERIFRQLAVAGLAMILIFGGIFALSLALHETDMPALAGQQGDRIWTESQVSGYNMPGNAGGSKVFMGLAFPYDTNAQPVAYYVDATTNNTADRVDFLGYDSSVTSYTTLSLDWCGGTTSMVKVASNAMATYANGHSGVSYFAIDDGAGTVGIGEFKQVLGGGRYWEIISGGSTFAIGSANADAYGPRDLSGVTFPANSRVFLLTRIGGLITGNATKQVDNDQGIVAATKGSPLVAVIQNNGVAAGVSNFSLTVKYQ